MSETVSDSAIDELIIRDLGRNHVKKAILQQASLLASTYKQLTPNELATRLDYIISMVRHFPETFQFAVAKQLNDAKVIKEEKFMNMVKAKALESGPYRKEKLPSQAQVLLEIMKQNVMEFWTNTSRPYVTLNTGRSYAADDDYFKSLLINLYTKKIGVPPNKEPLNQVVDCTRAICLHEGTKHSAHIRVAPCFENDELIGIYVDLANEKNEVVEISPTSVQVVKHPPVKFVQVAGGLSLPRPKEDDRQHLPWLQETFNLDEEQYILLLIFLVACLHPFGPYVILEITGEQGTGKSLLSKFIKMLIDPGKAALRSPAQNERDLMIWAYNSWLICLNNVSTIPIWMSDALCRLSWDGGFSTRKLYTDNQEIIFDQRRPIVVNGVGGRGSITRRPDLADRSIGIFLNVIPDDLRRAEKDLTDEFNKRYPYMLAELYSLVAGCLRNYKYVKLGAAPRMADIAAWVAGIEAPLGLAEGTTLKALLGYQLESRANLFEEDEFASFVFDFFSKYKSEYEGTASEVLSLMKYSFTDKKLPPWWPDSPEKFGRRLTRIAPLLRTKGLDLTYKRTSSRRVYRFSFIERPVLKLEEEFSDD